MIGWSTYVSVGLIILICVSPDVLMSENDFKRNERILSNNEKSLSVFFLIKIKRESLLFLYSSKANISLKIEMVSYVYFYCTFLMYSYLSQYLFIETKEQILRVSFMMMMMMIWIIMFLFIKNTDLIVSYHIYKCYVWKKLYPLRSTHIISHKTEMI